MILEGPRQAVEDRASLLGRCQRRPTDDARLGVAPHAGDQQVRPRVRLPVPCLARAYARRYGLPAPRVDQLGRLLLGDPGPRCQAALGWRPPAQPKATSRPAGRSRSAAARSSTAARATAARPSTTARRHRPTPAELAPATRAGLTAAAAPRLDPATAAYNRRAIARLGLGDPNRWPHLTRPGRR
jgi:hypothetical protein